MQSLTLEEKLSQFNEFFTIKHKINVNMRLLDNQFVPPPVDVLSEQMPYAFRIASEISTLESQALRPLRHLGEHASDLVTFLNHQSRKIDLMMSYILQQQDEPGNRFASEGFGGGGVTLISDHPLDIGQQAELKLFLTEEAAAVFCYGEVIACQSHDDQYHISLIFTRIREADQELLVRASLHLQTQQLRKRAQQTKND